MKNNKQFKIPVGPKDYALVDQKVKELHGEYGRLNQEVN